MAGVRRAGPSSADVWAWELRDVSPSRRQLDATVTVYDTPRDVGPFVETMAKGVFRHTLARHGDSVKLLDGHDGAEAVATPVGWRDGDTELGVTFQFGTTPAARDALARLDDDLYGGVSVGFLPGRGEDHNVWELRDDVWHVTRREARLLHVALVVTPAVEDAKILALRHLEVPDQVVPGTPRLEVARRILAHVRRSG